MKKRTVQFLGLIEVTILLGALALFVLSNPNTMRTFIDYTTKGLGLSYEKVSGNLLKSIKLKNITYHHKLLTKEASLDWNFRALFSASLKIDEITVKDLNIPLTQEWITDLQQKFASKESSDGMKEIPTIEISQIVFSALPFHEGNVSVQRIELQGNNIKGNLKHVDIGFFSFLTQNNYANITALGHMRSGILHFEKLWLENIDVLKITALMKEVNAKTENINTTKGSTQQIIKAVKADTVLIDILPVHMHKYFIKTSTVTLDHLSSDLKSLDVSKVYIDAITNIWYLVSEGNITHNKFYGKGDLHLHDKYFKKFVPFFNHDHITPITINLQVDPKSLTGDVSTKANNLLIKKYKDLKVSLPYVQGHVDFNFTTLVMNGEINATLTSKYTKKATLNSRIYYHDAFTYDGILNIPAVSALPPIVSTLLKDTNITFYGDTKKITAFAKSPYIRATYDGKTYQKEMLHITTEPLIPQMLKLQQVPQNLTSFKGRLQADIPIDFTHFMPLHAKYTLFSNLVDANGSATYSHKFQTKATIISPKESLLKQIVPKLKTKALFPLHLDLSYKISKADIDFQSKWLGGKILYDLNTTDCNSTLNLPDQAIHINGNIDNQFKVFIYTPSVREFQDKLHKLYAFDKVPADGELFIETTVTAKSRIKTSVKGKWFVYEYTPNKFAFAEKIRLSADYSKDTLTLHDYYFSTYLDRDRIFFANRPSRATFGKDGKINLQHLWINDGLRVNGSYDLPKKEGTLRAKSDNYHYNDLEGNFYFDTDLKMHLKEKSTDIEGNIQLNKGTITYEARKEHYVQDKDIIIVQKEQEKKSEQPHALTLDISIKTQKPMVYKISNTNVTFDADLKLWKEKNLDLELLGIVRILSGTHMENKKEFEIEPSEILFGGPILNPYLNIRAKHQSDPYTIYINVNGQLDAPLINFSATPFLTQSDILSILLFNSTTSDLVSGSQDTSKTAISMFGNAFAKEIVQHFGIKLDKLVLSTTEEGKIGIEVGKKLSKRITLIYINDIVQTIKVRYKISNHFESDFTFSPENSGVDIIYKDEY